MMEEGRWKREDGRGKKDDGRWKRECLMNRWRSGIMGR